MKYVAAIDQGTTSTRCIIFDHQANICSSFQKEHKQIYPQAGWVEHDPNEIFENSLTCLKSAIKTAGIKLTEISGLGITNQRETTVIWNKKTGLAYTNAIVWQDTRTDKICELLRKDGYEELIIAKTGLPVATYFSGPKIKWILDHNPNIRNDTNNNEVMFGNIDTWLIWNLTGGVDG